MISDEDRARMSKLALKALDTIEHEYGDEASLGDAVIVYEVLIPDGDHGHLITHGNYHSTTHRTAIVVGLLEMTAAWLKMPTDGPFPDELP